MNEGEAFIRDAAARRGIDPEIALRVAMSEGGVVPPGNVGRFDTGVSFWQFQLHYGGKFYEHLGTTAGMGNGFTALTGWQPGDPRAWRDATRYALNRAKASGWGAWYGAAHVGIGQWDGIDRNHEWNAAAEVWDYESREDETAVPTIPYNPDAPVDPQPNDWSCALQSVQWLLRSIGRSPDASDTTNDWWLTSQLVPGIIRPDVGLRNATGEDLAAWINREYGHEMGFVAHASPVRFDDVAAGAGVNPTMIGGRGWNHWSGVRALRSDGQLRLANPADSWKGVGQSMSREQFDALGPFTAVWIDRAGAAAPAPEPEPPSRKAVLISEIRERLTELEKIA